jgi:hypothetical protein
MMQACTLALLLLLLLLPNMSGNFGLPSSEPSSQLQMPHQALAVAAG